MSKQSEAKKRQNYRTPQTASCGKCRFFSFDKDLPRWMQEANERIAKDERLKYDPFLPYPREGNEVVMNRRCSIGGFAVASSGCCDEFEKAE